MARFFNVLSAEIVKTKRTWNLPIILLFPVLITFIVFGYYIKNLLGENSGEDNNLWIAYSRMCFQFYFFLYPLVAALIAFSLSNIEHRNNGFKQIFTFPTHKFNIYFSKVFILIFWIFASLLLAYLLLVLSGRTLGFLFPQAGFRDYNINQVISTFFLRIFLSLIAIISIHFFLSIYWDNFIVSVGSACFLVIFGIVVNSWEYSYLIPYCNLQKAFMNFMQNGSMVFSKEILWSLGYSVLFFTGGFLIMIRKSIK